jgi:RNA polymerase sigma-70 factor (ECF subfamily)
LWSTENRRDPRKEPALDDVRDQAVHGPEITRSRVRGLSDDDLTTALHAARAGEEDAFVTVWRSLHPSLLRYLRVRGDDGPEDLASETWMHVLRGLETFVGDAREFRAWLFTIARNRAVDAGRARARRPTVPVADVTELHPDPHRHAAPSAEDLAIDNDGTARALRLVATLPAVQAEMVMLRVVAGLDVAVVAEILGKKPGTVRVTVHRALQTLARDQRAASPSSQSPREVV